MVSIKWLSEAIDLKIDLKTNAYAFLHGKEVRKVIIAMHGFGDSGENFSNLASKFDVKGVLWIFLDALYPTSQIFGEGYQWFPIFSEPYYEVKESCDYVNSIIESISREFRLETRHIGLLGFSQGASLALQVSLRQKSILWLTLSLSGFLLNMRDLYENKSSLNTSARIFLAHGQDDSVVYPLSFYEARNFLNSIDCQVESHVYSIDHSLCPEEISDIKAFITENMDL